jgi:hypothetical protein
MTDQKDNNIAREMAVRTQALDMAIRSNCGQAYDTENHIVFDADDIVKAASKFAEFIKGTVTKTEEDRKVGW